MTRTRTKSVMPATKLAERPCVMIVDGDKVSQRAIELAIAPNKYVVEWARDGEAAFDIMRRVRVDVVVADSMLNDMPGITLVRRTTELCGPGAPSFLFVSADRANTTKIGLLMVGASDYMIKPFVADELRVRVQNMFAARRRARAEAVRGITGLAGDASQVPVPDILTMLELTRKTGTVHISVGPASGRIILEEGRVIHAEVSNLAGEDAFCALLQYNAGLYRFEPGLSAEVPRTLNQRVSEMLLESAVREDTQSRDALPRVLESTITSTAAMRELGIQRSSIDLRSRTTLESKPTPLTELTTRLGIAVADPYLLGDVVLTDAVPQSSVPQFHIELWTSVSEGVSAMLALASPPGYQVVAASLGEARHSLHLQFETAQARVIVTLVDLESPHDPPANAPDGLILVPPRGELISLAPQRLADLTARLDQPQKPVIVALGGAALQSTIGRIVDENGVRFLHLATRLEDLRDVIGGVIRLWNASR